MAAATCGFPDMRFKLESPWDHTNLTYRIDSYPTSGLKRKDVDDIFAKAFKVCTIVILGRTEV